MRKMLMPLLLGASALAAGSAQAQTPIEGRVGKLESEMRAVQRKVFPGGAGQYVDPQIRPEIADTTMPGTPATSPVADLDARVTTLEGRIGVLTGQIETTQHRVQMLEDGFAAYKAATDARIKQLESGAPAPAATMGSSGDGPAVAATPSTVAKPMTTAKPGAVAPPTLDPDRQRKLAAIEHPQTGDAAEDDYLYGYRLWQAKLYPEAEAQFKLVTTTYPKHKRASYAQNLLGRSYLEENKPSLASIAFYDNYHNWPNGDRAPDSLYYLAKVLVKLGKPASDVCQVYGALIKDYGTKISDEMKANVARGKAESKC